MWKNVKWGSIRITSKCYFLMWYHWSLRKFFNHQWPLSWFFLAWFDLPRSLKYLVRLSLSCVTGSVCTLQTLNLSVEVSTPPPETPLNISPSSCDTLYLLPTFFLSSPPSPPSCRCLIPYTVQKYLSEFQFAIWTPIAENWMSWVSGTFRLSHVGDFFLQCIIFQYFLLHNFFSHYFPCYIIVFLQNGIRRNSPPSEEGGPGRERRELTNSGVMCIGGGGELGWILDK